MIYIDIAFKLLICIILGIYTYKLDKLLTIFSLVDTVNEDDEEPKKKKKLSYNPANLFDPYGYPTDGDLDPVSPGERYVDRDEEEVTDKDGRR